MSDVHIRRLTVAHVVGFVFGATLCGAAIWSADPHATFLQPPNPAAPPGSLRMAGVVLMIGAIYFWSGVIAERQRARAVANSSHEAARPRLRRPANAAGGALLRWQAILAVWLALVAYPNAWTWETVGFKGPASTIAGLCVGILVYALFTALLTFYLRASGGLEKFADDSTRTMAGIWPRPRRQKAAAWIAFCVFNPVIEELLFRGVLVYQAALAMNSIWAPLLVGFAASIGNHWYQGRRMMALHIPFYWVAVGLLFSPLGLGGAIGFHIAGDVAPVSLMARQLRQFRQRHRVSSARG
ncbi:MAG: hypothetical protein JNL18_19245 [Planctomycetaceae bacterium]|nr:hypothetical protein [Planctomycetaceae bacterium]